MPRQLKRKKPYIVVFCEGESEQAYTDFLKKEFKDVASIKRPSSTGLFEDADSKFKKDKSYRDYAEVTDENSKRTLSNLLQDGLPSLDDTDERNCWLCRNCLTFSNVYEAIDFLTSLQ